MKKTILALALTTFTMAGVAVAAETGETAGKAAATAKPSTHVHAEFTKLDKNKDGFLEKKEVASNKALSRDFDKIADQGRVNEEKFAAWEKRHQAAHKSAQTEKSKKSEKAVE